jgi:uncharacterized protein YecA (UPF0149 family)
MTADGYTQDGAIERLVLLYSRLGKPEEIENLKKKYPPAQADKGVWEEQNQKEYKEESPGMVVPKRPKIGRNDPCSCGGGKKYKKCCLLKEND